jgi:hypothetical protein
MKRYVFNPTALVMLVGGMMIPPNDGREVDETLLPPELRDLPPQADPPSETTPESAAREALAKLLAGSVPALREQIPTFSDETLAALAALEGEAGNPRKTLLAAIAEAQLDRARLRAEAGKIDGTGDGTGAGTGDGGKDSKVGVSSENDPPPAG